MSKGNTYNSAIYILFSRIELVNVVTTENHSHISKFPNNNNLGFNSYLDVYGVSLYHQTTFGLVGFSLGTRPNRVGVAQLRLKAPSIDSMVKGKVKITWTLGHNILSQCKVKVKASVL